MKRKNLALIIVFSLFFHSVNAFDCVEEFSEASNESCIEVEILEETIIETESLSGDSNEISNDISKDNEINPMDMVYRKTSLNQKM